MKPAPTPAMRRALEALAAEGQLHIADFYRAMAVTNRGRYLVFKRMADRDWVETTNNHGDTHVRITPWGQEALAQ